MIKFNLLLVIRRLLRNKVYTAISVVSITVALAIVLFMLNFVVHELKTDQFHKNKDQIVRIITKWEGRPFFTRVPTVLAPTLKEEIPTIENYVRIQNYNPEKPIDVYTETISGKEENIFYTDQSFFDVFSFPIILGSVAKLDETPNALVISESKASKYFGDQNPIGQSISFVFYDDELKESPKQFQVVAVMKNFPTSSTIQTDFISNLIGKKGDVWGNYSVETYLQIHPDTNIQELEKQIAKTEFNHHSNQFDEEPDYASWKIQPLTDIHFHSNHIEGGSAGSLSFVKVVVVISILILVVAFFNYLLLNSSLSLKYFNTQKILHFNGATNKGTFVQESIYSLIQIILSIIFALPMAKLIHQYFGNYLGDNYQFVLYNNPFILLLILISCIGVGFIIALFLNRIISKSLNKIQSNSSNLATQRSFGSYFIVGQIVVFTALLMSSIVLVKQMDFIQKKDPGCNLSNTLSFVLRDFDKVPVLKEELLKAPFITRFSHGIPFQSQSNRIFEIVIENNPDLIVKSAILQEDNEFINVYEIPVIQGANLNPDKFPKTFDDFFRSSTSQVEVLVNKTFAKQLNVDNVIGTSLSTERIKNGVIVGVVDDFHYESYYSPIKPTIIAYKLTGLPNTYTVKFLPGYYKETENYVKDLFKKILPDVSFISLDYDPIEAYQKDINRAKLISGLTVVTIFISLLGLIGWSLLTTQNKIKEIGIRKINGATIAEIIALLNKNVVTWVAIASLFATPVAYYVMHKWLQNFAYKTELSWWVFALAGLLALGIALLTVSFQSWKAATRNPVEALRYE